MNIVNRHNRFARFLVNRFDFIIRLLYCKMRLYRLIHLFSPGLYSCNYDSLNSYFLIISKALERNGFSIRGKSVIEIGPGNSYINAYNFLHNGAREVVLVDKYPRYTNTDRQRAYIRNEIDYFKSRNNVKEFPYVNEVTGVLNGDFITFMPGDLRSIRLDRNVDFIYSIAVLQHVRELEQYIRKMAEILNPGGMMCHIVDLKDKFHVFGNPFLFYKYSDFIWNNFCTDDAVTYSNRVRYQDYVEIFKRNGFDLLHGNSWSYDFPGNRINKKFAGRSDLGIGDAQFLLIKR
ncbi:MAG: methyltransferase domain-containing protein [Spirochaetes bacterium]|nr:methyltransferase domain-containing protein [Spirochaetota bacterium]